MLHFVHHPGYAASRPRRGGFRFDKYTLVRQQLLASGEAVTIHEPEPMPRRWIEAVHDAGYVEEVLSASVPQEKERRIGFPVTAEIVRRSLLAQGGTWLSAKLALDHGYAANGAGGSHHALPDTGAGYCVFNDLAVAANRLLSEKDVKRILILDCDVHQGDGTAVLLAGRPEIFTLSFHAERNFPVQKARSSLDVSLPDALDDAGYLAMLENHLPPVLGDFRPDLVLYQAGVDPHRDDRLGRLALGCAGLDKRDAFVANACRELGVPLASTLGGGYADDPGVIAERHARSILTCARVSAGLSTVN